jgi:dihydroorotate dehydrogenase
LTQKSALLFLDSILSKIPGFSSIFKLLYGINDKRLETEVFGLKFKNPVGLAAGFDKDAFCIKNCPILVL